MDPVPVVAALIVRSVVMVAFQPLDLSPVYAPAADSNAEEDSVRVMVEVSVMVSVEYRVR